MWQVFVWVPSKGWKMVKSTKDRGKAIETALEFVPLEVKLCHPTGRSYYSGILHVVSSNVPEEAQIERLRDQVATESVATV